MKRTICAVIVAAVALGAQVATASAAHAGPKSPDGQLDARAAAAASGSIGINSTWYSGTVAAGASQGWTWNNAPATAAYIVGFNPSGASTSSTCSFEVTSSRYVQQYGGEREFQFWIKNIGSI